ncbi:MAG: cell division protein ZapB [Bryobacteraceae bacterium]|nr:cell division protein ZapB [Bryobacteraceae bacterium]
MTTIGNPPQVDADALASLEERILRAVQLVTQLRQQKDAAQRLADSSVADKEAAESALAGMKVENARLVEEMEALRADRTKVKARIEKLLGQLDNLAV